MTPHPQYAIVTPVPAPEDSPVRREFRIDLTLNRAYDGRLQLMAMATGRRSVQHLLQSAIATWDGLTDAQSRGATIQIVHPDGTVEALPNLTHLETPPFA